MCAYPTSQHALPRWKCVLCCCSNCPCIDIPGQESYRNHFNTSPSISFHIYNLIERCTIHGRRPLDEKKFCRLCLQILDSVPPAKLYTRKELIMTEKYIYEFHTSFYISRIKKLAFHLLNVWIIGTNHCGNTCFEAFKCRRENQDVLSLRDYDEIAVASFAQQINS